MNKIINKNRFIWIPVVVLLQIMILVVNYRGVDIRYPISYGGGDVMGVFYYAKMIDEFGINLENPMTGGADGSNMYDYPYSDTLSFLTVKAIGFFTDNPFLIINCFYFLCSIISAVISYIVICKRNRYFWIAISLSILYANAPFFQFRYGHMWLVPYFLLPLECDLALNILDDNIVKDGISIWKNKSFYLGLVIAFICAFTGLYYAFFACALFAMAMVIRIIRTVRIKCNLYPVVFIASTITGCGLNYIPNLIYYKKFGKNPMSEVSIRSMGDCEYYGLKLVQLLLPRTNHRVQFLSDLNEKYRTNFPLVTENNTASMGIVASIGLIIALIWLFSAKKNKSKSYLIMATFLVATIGGISSLISLFVSMPMRCYNRMSLVIMFLSLLCVAEVLENISDHIPQLLIIFGMVVILLLGIFDQTVAITQYDRATIDDDRRFVETIEANTEDGDLIFELPYVNWPSGSQYRMFIGYIYSHNLRWSYGAMQGREEANWQESVAVLPVTEMLEEIIDKGYMGVYFDTTVYEAIYGEGTASDFINSIREQLGDAYITNDAGTLYFWGLEDYIKNGNGVTQDVT